MPEMDFFIVKATRDEAIATRMMITRRTWKWTFVVVWIFLKSRWKWISAFVVVIGVVGEPCPIAAVDNLIVVVTVIGAHRRTVWSTNYATPCFHGSQSNRRIFREKIFVRMQSNAPNRTVLVFLVLGEPNRLFETFSRIKRSEDAVVWTNVFEVAGTSCSW